MSGVEREPLSSDDCSSRSGDESSESEEYPDPTQMINCTMRSIEIPPPPASPVVARPPSRGKGCLGLGLSPYAGKGPRKQPPVEEEEEEKAAPAAVEEVSRFVPIAAPLPLAGTDLAVMAAPLQLPQTFEEMERFAVQLQTRTIIQSQQLMQLQSQQLMQYVGAQVKNTVTELTNLTKSAEKQMLHNIGVVTRKMDDLKEQFQQQIDRVDAMKSLDVRTVVEFLIRFGMDTRKGFVCGLPMHINSELYVVVNIPLLGYAMKRLSPALIKTHSLTNPNISKIMARLDPVTMNVDKDVLMVQMGKVFGIREYAPSARVADTWAVFTVDHFLRMLRDLRRQNQTLDPSAFTPYDKIKYTTGDRVPISQESATTSKLRHKMAWAKEVQREVLALPSIREFFMRLSGRGAGAAAAAAAASDEEEEEDEFSKPFHFCGDVPDFQHPVRSHAALREAWRQADERPAHGKGKKKRKAESEEEEDDDNDDSASVASEDEETDEQPAARARGAVSSKKRKVSPPSPPKRLGLGEKVGHWKAARAEAERAALAKKAAVFRTGKRVPTGDDDSEVLA